jgi:hypothetical protein
LKPRSFASVDYAGLQRREFGLLRDWDAGEDEAARR